MNLNQPSRHSFWNFVLIVSSILPLLSIWQSIVLAHALEIDIPSRPAWIGLLTALFILGMIPLLAFAVAWIRRTESILALAESPERMLNKFSWLGWPLLIISVTGYTLVFAHPFFRDLFGGEGWLRLYVFWVFSLIGMYAIKFVRPSISWFISLVLMVLIQTTTHLMMVQFSHVTDYPFAMGWSETTRFYQASLFVSDWVYDQRLPFPFINTTLEVLLAPAYLLRLPLWGHRLWQVAVRVALLAGTAFALTERTTGVGAPSRAPLFLWMLLYLFVGPLYFHLTIPIMIMLLGFSHTKERKAWFVLILASIWAGWSRVNWYPVPGAIAAVLYFLEVPVQGKNIWKYLLRPALWIFVGVIVAFLSQRFYVLISGVPPAYFYTSFSSELLWYRLWPNASYFLGMLPAAVIASLPVWLVMYVVLRNRQGIFHPLRLLLIFAALFVLFIGGLAVSLKIGGGVDLHNMDAYFIVLVIVTGYLVFDRYTREDGAVQPPASLHWGLVVLMLLVPVWSQLRFNVRLNSYDVDRTEQVLFALQERVNLVNAQNEEMLFISQRHLISMNMLQDVKLVHEYEREDLMEMAMGRNEAYLSQFRSDMESQRFAVVVVDPLNYSIYSRARSFSEENNVWVSEVMRHILCNYRLDISFPEDSIALYIPQEGERQCPQQ